MRTYEIRHYGSTGTSYETIATVEASTAREALAAHIPSTVEIGEVSHAYAHSLPVRGYAGVDDSYEWEAFAVEAQE